MASFSVRSKQMAQLVCSAISFATILGGAAEARAESLPLPCSSSAAPPTAGPSMVGTVGNLRDIATGQLDGRVPLSALPGTGPLWALGMPNGLNRELLVEAGRISSSSFADRQRLEVRHHVSIEAAFLVYARVPSWCSVALPPEVVDFATLQTFVGEAAARTSFDAEQAFPFRLRARARTLRWFVVGGPGNQTPTARGSFERARVLGGLDDTSIEALGFYSRRGRGTISNPHSDMHIHFRTTSGPAFIAHLDDEITFEAGAVLLLPETVAPVAKTASDSPAGKHP
jgi:hypothetical protein